ncbi:hypothetical protein DVH05_017050 [Phytophthora capsici]|nr:hypothetical protein DVH05_017050 [Phytophthora capsici]
MKARDVAAEAGVLDLMASDKWVVGFKRRHQFSLRTTTRQVHISPADIQAVANAFAADVQAMMLNLGISRVKKTLCKREAKTLWVKCSGASKERATVMLLGDSNGYRCTPFVVFKVKPSRKPMIQIQNNKVRHGFGKRIWKRISPV